MTTRRTGRRRGAAAANAILAAVLLAGCGGGGIDDESGAAARSSAAVPGPTIGLAEPAPASLGFVDRSVAPSTGTIGPGSDAVGVHSAPDPLYTRLGQVGSGDRVGLTGNRAEVDGQEWAEIIWLDHTGWIPASALAP